MNKDQVRKMAWGAICVTVNTPMEGNKIQMSTTKTLDKEQLQKLVQALNVAASVALNQSEYLTDYLPELASKIYEDNLGTTAGGKQELLGRILSTVDCFENTSQYCSALLQCIFAAFGQKYTPGLNKELTSKSDIERYMKNMSLVISNTDFLIQRTQEVFVLMRVVVSMDASEFGKQASTINICRDEFEKEFVRLVEFKEYFKQLLQLTDPANSFLNSDYPGKK